MLAAAAMTATRAVSPERRLVAVPSGKEHHAARTLLGHATAEDVLRTREEQEKERRQAAVMAQVAKAVGRRQQQLRQDCLSRHRVEQLWHAARFGDLRPFEELAGRVRSMRRLLSLRDGARRTPLHLLCKGGFLPCLRVCVPRPPQETENDYYKMVEWRRDAAVVTHTALTAKGYTPLHFAVAGGHINCVRYLLGCYACTGTLEEEFFVEAGGAGRNCVAIAKEYQWNHIRQLLETTITPYYERITQRKVLSIVRQEEVARREAETAWRKELEEKEYTHRKVYIESLQRLDVRREADRTRRKQAAVRSQEHSRDLRLHHEKWEEGVRARTQALEGRRNGDASGGDEDGSDDDGGGRADEKGDNDGGWGADVIRAIRREHRLDPVKASESRRDDWMPGDDTEWNRLLTRQAEDAETTVAIKRAAERRVKDVWLHVRLGVDVSEGVRFGRLGAVAFGGLRIVGVRGGSPAEASGLRVGDVIVSLNGAELRTLDDMRRTVDATQVKDGEEGLLRLVLRRRRCLGNGGDDDEGSAAAAAAAAADAAETAHVVVDVSPATAKELPKERRLGTVRVKAAGVLWRDPPPVQGCAEKPVLWMPSGSAGGVSGGGGVKLGPLPLPLPRPAAALVCAADGAAAAERRRPWTEATPVLEGPLPVDAVPAVHSAEWRPVYL